VDEARRERLRDYWLGVQFTDEEARTLGNEIIEHHISGVDWLSDVFPPTGYWKNFLSPKPVYNESTYWNHAAGGRSKARKAETLWMNW
jgi:hypothetical protein